MRILTITAEYPPFFVGGITLHAHDLNKRLYGKGFRPCVITFQSEPDGQNIQIDYEENVWVARILPPQISETAPYIEKFYAQNQKMLEGLHWMKDNGYDFDLLVLHGYFLANAAIQAKVLFQCPLVYHVHTLYSSRKSALGSSDPLLQAERHICYTADKIISVSSYLTDRVCDTLEISKDKMTVITKAIDLVEYDEVPDSRDSSAKKVIYVGRISHEKGIETLLHAFSNVLKRLIGNVYLYIVGLASDAEYLQRIKQIAHNLALEKNITYLGYMNSDEIIEMYKACDVAVVPSYMETFGKVAIEAMAAKIPVIVSDVGGLGPIVEHEKTGLKFTAGNAIELADNIWRILHDVELASHLTESAYQEVSDRYQWHRILCETVKVYKEVSGV